MHTTHHRLQAAAALVLAALALSAAPALASEGDCDDEDDCGQNTPAQVLPTPATPPTPPTPATPVTPAPVLQAPVPQAPQPGQPAARVRAQRRTHRQPRRHVTTRFAVRRVQRTVRPRRTAERRSVTRGVTLQTVPRGGVQAGAGGMAPQEPGGILLGFAGGALMLLAGGGLVARGRRGG